MSLDFFLGMIVGGLLVFGLLTYYFTRVVAKQARKRDE